MLSGISDSVPDSDLESTVTSIFLVMKLILNQVKCRTAKESGNLIMAFKRLYQ